VVADEDEVGVKWDDDGEERRRRVVWRLLGTPFWVCHPSRFLMGMAGPLTPPEVQHGEVLA
jgi:hypothetical protein